MSRLVTLAALIALSLGSLAACANPREISDSEAASLLKKDLLSKDAAKAGVRFSDDEADCISTAWVKKFGVPGLFDAGLLTTDGSGSDNHIATEDAKVAVAIMAKCSDLVKITLAGKVTKKAPPAVRTCMHKVFDEAMVRRVWVDALDGISSTQARAEREIKTCVKKQLHR